MNEKLNLTVKSVVLQTLDSTGKITDTETVQYYCNTKKDRIKNTTRLGLKKSFENDSPLTLKIGIVKFCKPLFKRKEVFFHHTDYRIEMRCSEGTWVL